MVTLPFCWTRSESSLKPRAPRELKILLQYQNEMVSIIAEKPREGNKLR